MADYVGHKCRVLESTGFMREFEGDNARAQLPITPGLTGTVEGESEAPWGILFAVRFDDGSRGMVPARKVALRIFSN